MISCQRDRFSIPLDRHYLNCAYMSPLSKRVEEAGIAGVRRKARPYEIRPTDFYTGCDRVRDLFGKLINAPASRIAIIPSASYGLAAVAKNLRLARGQNVVVAHDQFPANMYAWRRSTAESGGEMRVVRAPADDHRRGRLWNEAVLEAIDGRTGVVALGNVHWTDGTRFDLERIGERAREVGAALVVDGTQSVGAMPTDVSVFRPDALICAAYKWLTGPYAIGVAYLGERFDDGVPLEETWIGREGSENFARLVDYQDRYRSGMARYDMGECSNFALVPMLIAALEQLTEWTVPGIAEYCRKLSEPLIAGVQERGFRVEDAEWRGAHLFGLRMPPNRNLEDLHTKLEARHVFVSVRGSVIRVAPHVYNDQSDIHALLEAIGS
jgi:selenocysteine lyase/cysteine desulfurase